MSAAPGALHDRDAEGCFPEIDGHSPAVRNLKRHMRRVAADADVTVLIVGESGTGKERIAQAIHRASPRHRGPFVVVNCAGLSPSLAEDELFGHVRGAFTGAVDDRVGPFERASGGTLFLDEVGELPLELQKRLLRALQERTVQRLGARHEASFDVRVVAATNVDLARAREQGRFRDDLYYRLKVYELVVPPLRRRGAADIRELADSILKRFAERRRRPPLKVEREVLDVFACYSWPGNVRELENTLEYMAVGASGGSWLTTDHLPEDFGRGDLQGSGVRLGGVSLPRPRRAMPPLAEVVATLERFDFRHGRAAAALGLSRHQLYRLLKRARIGRSDGDA